MSILEAVENAVPISNGDQPDLAFQVVGPGDEIQAGVGYGYPVWTHCGLPAIGPLNGTYWVGAMVDSIGPFDVAGWGGYVLGFLRLNPNGEIEYSIEGQLIARYLPDPGYEVQLCA
jgi:hypothetical protein